MHSDFGKISRKVAIDCNHSVSYMAMTLGVTPNYLSEVQHGKELTHKLAKEFIIQYKDYLTKDQRKEILALAKNTQFAKVVFKVNKCCPHHVEKMISIMETKINSLSEDAALNIIKILEWDGYNEMA